MLKRDAEIDALNKKLELARDAGVDEITRRDRSYAIDEELRDTLRQIDDDRKFLRRCNIGGESMSKEEQDRVAQIGLGYHWRDPIGNTADFLTDDELKNLTIRAAR